MELAVQRRKAGLFGKHAQHGLSQAYATLEK